MKDENWLENDPVPVLERGVKTLYSKTWMGAKSA